MRNDFILSSRRKSKISASNSLRLNLLVPGENPVVLSCRLSFLLFFARCRPCLSPWGSELGDEALRSLPGLERDSEADGDGEGVLQRHLVRSMQARHRVPKAHRRGQFDQDAKTVQHVGQLDDDFE